MIQQTDVNIFLQGLRGNQAVIVLAFLLIRRAMTIDEIEDATGLNSDTVRSAVRGLASKNMLFMQRGERGRQTWLPCADTFLGALMFQNREFSDSEIQIRKTSDSGSSSSNIKRLVASIEPEEEEDTADSEKFGFCLRACDEAGIREPARSRISRLKHVTPEFIRAHVEQVQADGMMIGTAIHRIEYNWPAPEHRAGDMLRTTNRGKRGSETLIVPWDIVQEVAGFTGHRAECSCMDCTIGRMRGLAWLCPECRKYQCECEEE